MWGYVRISGVHAAVCTAALLIGFGLPIGTVTWVADARPVDRAAALDDATAAAIARAFNHPVVVASATTGTSQTLALPDGTEQITVYREPVRVHTPTGWAPIAAAQPADQSTTDTSVTPDTTHDATGGRQAFTYVDNAYPNQSYWNGASAPDAYMHVGYVQSAWSDDNKNHLTRSFFQIDTRSFAGRTVLAAKLNLNLGYTPSCTAKQFDVWLSNDASSATTWNNQPAVAGPPLTWHATPRPMTFSTPDVRCPEAVH
jgi:hypothetical protein